jgi:exosortase
MATMPAARQELPPTPPPAASPPLLLVLRGAWEQPGSRPALLGGAIGLALLAAAFWPTLRHFAYTWSSDENYSHGFLVPLISLYFANEAARRGPVAVRGGAFLGAGLLVASVLGRLGTVLVPVGFVGDLSFLLGLAGVVALMAGREALWRYGFAIGFLIFMVPLPIHLYSMIATPLQLLVSQVASEILNATGIPVLREGNTLTLPGDVKMFVAEACSGMRQLTGFLALTTAWAYLTPRPLWYRSFLIASSIPIAMTANVTRVTLTGWIMYYNPAYAMGTFHTIEGLLMMGFGLALLRAECLVLDLLISPTPGPEAAPSRAGQPA